MASHNELGEAGEDMAVAYLKRSGFEILHRNWRHSYHEIDIIALKNNLLHIVEVKTRKSIAGGHPEESVTKKKFKHLVNAADAFLHQNPGYRLIQFDILAITLKNGNEPEFFLIEDIFL